MGPLNSGNLSEKVDNEGIDLLHGTGPDLEEHVELSTEHVHLLNIGMFCEFPAQVALRENFVSTRCTIPDANQDEGQGGSVYGRRVDDTSIGVDNAMTLKSLDPGMNT